MGLKSVTEYVLAVMCVCVADGLPGVTFDTGGISIKPAAGMAAMRGDMGGAACVAATVMGVAQQQVATRCVCAGSPTVPQLV